MGGLACAIVRNAELRFQEVPTRPVAVKAFDKQMRDLFTTANIAEAVAENHDRAREVCEILAKPTWTHADRVILFEVVEHTYED